MTADELLEDLGRKIRNGTISGDDTIVIRNPEVSEGAMSAGSDGYHEVEEILVPRDGRVILLGETY